MKRCPQCLFIYPESDERCDFDNTPLVVINDSEIDAATKPRRKSKIRLLLIAVAFVAAFSMFVLYKISSQASAESAADIPVVAPAASALPETPSTPTPLPSPSASPSLSPKASPTRATTSHTTSSLNPVSTGRPATGTERGNKPVILLTDGGKIEADEVWRTRDGVWYRRNGMVTLLKNGRVRSIVNR